MFDVVLAVTYYTPYVSGLTEVVRTEAEGLAKKGYRVLVVTNQHDPDLLLTQFIEGVRVIRCPISFKLGRGVMSSRFISTVVKYAKQSKSVHIHMPMLEAGAIAYALRNENTRVVLTHHIDLWLPKTFASNLAIKAVDISTELAIRFSHCVVVNSADQAMGSKFWSSLKGRKWTAIPAACRDRRGGMPKYRKTKETHFGFLGRIVEDKGLGYLVEAFSRLEDSNCRLLIGGDYLDVAGGSVLTELKTRIQQDSRIEVLGLLRGDELNDFYASIDVFVLPSVAESFGIVQAEAIMMGIPSVTTNLPGGRYPVKATGMGWIVEPRSVESLFKAMKNALSTDWSDSRNQMEWARLEFGVDTFLKKHLEVLELN